MRDLKDTTGTGTKKIKLIDQLNFSTGYNFLADSCRMNNVGVTMSTSIFGKLGINANANFDPYAVLVDQNNPSGRKINRFAVQEGQGLMRLTNASVSLSYSLSGEGKINGNDGTKQAGGNPADHYTRIYYHPVTGEYIPGGWLYYMCLGPSISTIRFHTARPISIPTDRSYRTTDTLRLSGLAET